MLREDSRHASGCDYLSSFIRRDVYEALWLCKDVSQESLNAKQCL